MSWKASFLVAFAIVLPGEALSQAASDHPFSGRSITYRTGYATRSCLRSNNRCETHRTAFGTWEQLYISPDGEVERFTHSEHTYTFRLGQANDQGILYRFDGRDFVYRTEREVWTFRARGNRCTISVRAEDPSDDPFRTTINLTRQECQLTQGRRPWNHGD